MRGIKKEIIKEKVCPGTDDIQMESIWKLVSLTQQSCKSYLSRSAEQGLETIRSYCRQLPPCFAADTSTQRTQGRRLYNYGHDFIPLTRHPSSKNFYNWKFVAMLLSTLLVFPVWGFSCFAIDTLNKYSLDTYVVLSINMGMGLDYKWLTPHCPFYHQLSV